MKHDEFCYYEECDNKAFFRDMRIENLIQELPSGSHVSRRVTASPPIVTSAATLTLIASSSGCSTVVGSPRSDPG